MVKSAKLFQNGRSQAVRLPKDCRFEGDHVLVNRVGSCVILVPGNDPWAPLWEAGKMVTKDFMENRDQGSQRRSNPFAP